MGPTEQHSPVRFAAWQREYEASVFESDPAKLPGLIRNAQVAIANRLEYLKDESYPEEKAAIANAMMFLGLLARGMDKHNKLFPSKAS